MVYPNPQTGVELEEGIMGRASFGIDIPAKLPEMEQHFELIGVMKS